MARRYSELASLIEPGKAPKTDRNLILEDAIRVISHMRAENNQLRQLNKFLEEKVRDHEQAKGQALYQQTMQMQGGLHAAAGASTSQPCAGQARPATPGALPCGLLRHIYTACAIQMRPVLYLITGSM